MFSKEQLFEIFKDNAGKALVFRYKGNPPFESDTHHVFMILYRAPRTGEILMVKGSSRYDKIFQTLERMNRDPSNTLISIEPGAYNFFPLKTAIDCNTVYEMSLDALRIEDFEYVTNGKIRDDDMARIIMGIKNSPSIAPRIKELLD